METVLVAILLVGAVQASAVTIDLIETPGSEFGIQTVPGTYSAPPLGDISVVEVLDGPGGPVSDFVGAWVTPFFATAGFWSTDPPPTLPTWVADYINSHIGSLPSVLEGTTLQPVINLDGVTVEFQLDPAAVPEPSTLVLLGSGLAVLGISLRKRLRVT